MPRAPRPRRPADRARSRGARATRPSSDGSAPAIAALKRATACEPPKASSSRSSSVTPNDARAAWRSTPANERIGVPDTNARDPKASSVGGNETATRVASRPTARVARPGTTFPSQTSDGMRSIARRQHERQREVAAGREQDVGTQPAEEQGRLGHGAAEPQRVEHEVDVAPCRAQRAHHQLVVRKPIAQHVAGHEPALEATGTTDVGQLSVGLDVEERSGDGQRGVDVPAGSAARKRTPHRAAILACGLLARSTTGCRSR